MAARAALRGYSTIAPYYDRYMAHPAFPAWIRRIERVARLHGYDGGAVLDAACGTGLSLEPLKSLGYEVAGFDGSAEMLGQARAKLGEGISLHRYDVCELPVLGHFALITWLGDACNCLLDPAELRTALTRLEANLRPGGLLVFDVSTLATFGGVFAESHRRSSGDIEFSWEGHAREPVAGCLAAATLTVSERASGAVIAVSEHVQRHHPHEVIATALAAAGLELRARLGQEPGGALTSAPRAGQPKLLYITQKPVSATSERRKDAEGQDAAEAGRAGAGDHQARLVTSGARAGDGPGVLASSRHPSEW